MLGSSRCTFLLTTSFHFLSPKSSTYTYFVCSIWARLTEVSISIINFQIYRLLLLFVSSSRSMWDILLTISPFDPITCPFIYPFIIAPHSCPDCTHIQPKTPKPHLSKLVKPEQTVSRQASQVPLLPSSATLAIFAYFLSDIHIAADNVLVLFHDPELGRTTTGSGKIHEQPWAGVLE